MIKEKVKAIWCDHCNAEIMPAGVKGCLRKTCATKAALSDRDRQRRDHTL